MERLDDNNTLSRLLRCACGIDYNRACGKSVLRIAGFGEKCSVRKYRILFWAGLLLGGMFFSTIPSAQAEKLFQIPTVNIPTVTGVPPGPMAEVKRDINLDQINVRSGPNTTYDAIGVLLAGQEVSALGRTPGGLWIQIAYPGVPGGVGWVYAPYVNVVGDLPIVEPPPTPTPRTTPTIDPTLAAQFIVEIPPSRLPTFTPPPPLVIPSFSSLASPETTPRVPIAFVIIDLGVIGIFGLLISLLRGR